MNPLHAEIAALRAENESLKAEVAILRDEVAPAPVLRLRGVEISPSEGQVLALLLRRSSVTRDQISIALWGDSAPACEKATIRVLIFRLRAKLASREVYIDHTRGEGYRISTEYKARLSALVEAEPS